MFCKCDNKLSKYTGNVGSKCREKEQIIWTYNKNKVKLKSSNFFFPILLQVSTANYSKKKFSLYVTCKLRDSDRVD